MTNFNANQVGYNGIQPNPHLEHSNYHLLDSGAIYEQLNHNATERYLGRELNRQAVELIYARDSIVRKVATMFGHSMANAPYEIQSNDPDIASYVRDSLDAIGLFDWLGEAYIYATIYEESFLVLDEDWQYSFAVKGIAHAGNAWQERDDYFSFYSNERKQESFRQNQLLQISSSDSLSRFYFEYEKYITAVEQIAALIPVSELLICRQEKLSDDLKRMAPDEQVRFMQDKINSIRSGAYNRGIIVGDAKLAVELLHRELKEIAIGLDILREQLIAASNLPEVFLFGKNKAGSGLAALDEVAKASFAEAVDSRRKVHWTRIVNWVIGRLLERIGEDPDRASIKWSNSYRIDPEKLASVDKITAEKDKIYIESEVLSPEEVRLSRFSGKIQTKEVFIPETKNTKQKYTAPSDPLKEEPTDLPERPWTEAEKQFAPTEVNSYGLGIGEMIGKDSFDDQIYSDDWNYLLDAAEDPRNLWSKYKNAVNMTYSELLSWSKDKRSNLASLDRTPLRRNLVLLKANFERFQKSKTLQSNAKRTIAFIARMRGMPDGKIIKKAGMSKRNISLLNWAYDPYKSRGTTIPKNPNDRTDMRSQCNSTSQLRKNSSSLSDNVVKDLRQKVSEFVFKYPSYKNSVSLGTLIQVHQDAACQNQNPEDRVDQYLYYVVHGRLINEEEK